MWNSFLLILSSICYVFGASKISSRFLAMTIQMSNVKKVVVPMTNIVKQSIIELKQYDVEIVWEDKDLIRELGDKRTNDISLPKSVLDVN
jgi:hypothetical protein